MRMQITVDGKAYKIHRDVAHTHPAAVHEAMGTESEAQLQAVLDGQNVSNWYDRDGNHLGPDEFGLEMFKHD